MKEVKTGKVNFNKFFFAQYIQNITSTQNQYKKY